MVEDRGGELRLASRPPRQHAPTPHTNPPPSPLFRYEPGELVKQVNRVAKIDRLPSHNSPEALKTLRAAWDAVDIYTNAARGYKRATKISFALQLAVGVFMTSFVTFGAMNRNSCGKREMIPEETRQMVVVGLSLFGTMLTAGIAFLDPGTKWTQMRGAASAIESEVWKVRG